MGCIISKIKAFNKEGHNGESFYQLYEPDLDAVGIELKVEVKGITEEYLECGRLEMNYLIPSENDFQKLDPIIFKSCRSKKDKSSRNNEDNSSTSNENKTYTCSEEKVLIFDNLLENELIIELCLINTDKFWITTTDSTWWKMKTSDTRYAINFLGTITCDLTITKMEPDCQFQDMLTLCQEETDFVKKRKGIVFNYLQENNLFSIQQKEDVPNIAIIGSGGGMRAVIGMSAAMTALKDNKITDLAMYTAGLSGSAWYLLTLYAKDDFDPHTVMEQIRQNLHDFNGTKCRILWKLLKRYGKSLFVYHSSRPRFTNVFGEVIAKLLIKEECKVKWSDQRKLLENGHVPLPLVAALHVRDEQTSYDHNEWVEFSPYQAYIPRYGTGINMMYFGKQFYGGFCTRRYNEKSIAFLQGMCGSAYTKVRDIRPSGTTVFSFWSVKKKLIWYLFILFDRLFVARVPNILFGITSYTHHPGNQGVNDINEAGRTESMANSYTWIQDFWESVSKYLEDLVDVKKKTMMLVDAGLAFNSPYPTIMRASRKVDLILSFDFSERDDDKQSPFEELLLAEKWAKSRKVKFPKIEAELIEIEKLRGKRQYEEVYIFECDGGPTIMHFVMVNNSFRQNACQICNDFDIFPVYETLRFNYTGKEFNKLHYLIRHNVKANIEKINKCVKKAIKKKTQQRLDN